MQKYFEKEMAQLKDIAKNFAKFSPEFAKYFDEHSQDYKDPHIDRLFEAFAYLSAQIKIQIDDDYPKIIETLLQHLAPDILRPEPSSSIIKFDVNQKLLQQSYTIDKGTKIFAKNTAFLQSNCFFRTMHDLVIHPFELINFTKNKCSNDENILSLKFQFYHPNNLNKLTVRSIPIYLLGDFNTSLALYFAFTRNIQKIKITICGESNEVIFLKSNAIKPGYIDEFILNAINEKSFFAGALLRNYFSCQHNFLFINLEHLDSIVWPNGTKSFLVEIYTQENIDHLEFNASNLQLNCVPAINLIESNSEPINYSPLKNDHEVITDHHAKNEMFLYSVDEVTGMLKSTKEKISYSPLQHRHKFHRDNDYFIIQDSYHGGIKKSFLSLNSPNHDLTQTLSCKITVSNGDLPQRFLGKNSLNKLQNHQSDFVTCTNITEISAYAKAPQQKYLFWMIFSHISNHLSSISSADNLKNLLHTYNWTNSRENHLKISAITQVTVTPLHRIFRGVLYHGIHYKIALHEENYLSTDDIYLFAQVLLKFLKTFISMNHFIELTILLEPSKTILDWPAHYGEMPLI